MSILKFNKRGFTLIELLVVVAIMAILLALTTPFILSSIAATRLSSSGEQLISLFSSARQIASSEGRPIEFRIFSVVDEEETGDETPVYKHIALLRHYEIGEANPDPTPANSGKPLTAPVSVIVGQVLKLPEGVAIANSTTASTLATDATLVAAAKNSVNTLKQIKDGAMSDYEFPQKIVASSSFSIKEEGANLDPTQKWCLTLTTTADAISSSAPDTFKNFFCIQLDPVNGRVVSYRP